MGWIRIILKAPALAMVVCLAYVVAAGGGWFAAAWGRLARRPGAAGRWQAVVFRCTARGLAAILGMRIEVRGIPPAEPFVLVSNHLSYVDVILIGVGVVQPCPGSRGVQRLEQRVPGKSREHD